MLNLMEVEVIKDTEPRLYFNLNLDPIVFVFLAKMWLFLGFGMLKPDYDHQPLSPNLGSRVDLHHSSVIEKDLTSNCFGNLLSLVVIIPAERTSSTQISPTCFSIFHSYGFESGL